jgi:phosphoglycolate phosphatase
MRKSILLTDIDNTLYNWPALFAPSFRGMVHALTRELSLPEEQLYDEFKSVFAWHGSLEYPYAIQELESVKSMNPERVREIVKHGRGAFRSVQSKRLQLAVYPGVIETLVWLRQQHVEVIGVTNSPAWRAQQRLYDLELDSLLTGLVAFEGYPRAVDDSATEGFVKTGHVRRKTRLSHVWYIPEFELKPNELHYVRALEAMGAKACDAWVVGDSKAKDLEPAARLGIRTIWAEYGAEFDPTHPDMATLLRITPWSSSQIHTTYKKKDFEPDETIDDFRKLKEIIPGIYLSLF